MGRVPRDTRVCVELDTKVSFNFCNFGLILRAASALARWRRERVAVRSCCVGYYVQFKPLTNNFGVAWPGAPPCRAPPGPGRAPRAEPTSCPASAASAHEGQIIMHHCLLLRNSTALGALVQHGRRDERIVPARPAWPRPACCSRPGPRASGGRLETERNWHRLLA